jgi:hypothetical protein
MIPGGSAIGATPIGGGPDFNTVLRSSLTEAGLRRIVNGHSPIKVGDLRGRSLNEAGYAIAHLRPVQKTETAGRATASKRKTSIKTSAAPTEARRQLNYWNRVKRELHLLLCTKDKKYAALRRQLRSKGGHTQMVLVGTISASVGSSLGLGAGAVVPLAALCLIAALRVGVEAYCSSFENLKL